MTNLTQIKIQEAALTLQFDAALEAEDFDTIRALEPKFEELYAQERAIRDASRTFTNGAWTQDIEHYAGV